EAISEEPGAGNPHAGFCGGLSRQLGGLSTRRVVRDDEPYSILFHLWMVLFLASSTISFLIVSHSASLPRHTGIKSKGMNSDAKI
ncbi:hypothetical protein ACFFIX_27090, partial [Metabacillus herbersteinensis]